MSIRMTTLHLVAFLSVVLLVAPAFDAVLAICEGG
jgi:hypothetical protein